MHRKKTLEMILRFMARLVLRKYRPIIVGITGSVGKSSAKEAITLVLSKHYFVRAAEGNYNNEIGIPLTIIGMKSGGTSLMRWLWIGMRWLWIIVFPARYPEVLILEMGIDRPGDMEYLLSFVPANIGVATQVSSSHVAFFGSVGNIAKEKGKLITTLPEDGFAILNADDKRVLKMGEKTKAKIITYGFGMEASLRADNLIFHRETKPIGGFSFKLNHDGKSIPVHLPHIVAAHHIPAALAAAAVGVALKVNFVDIASALEGFVTLPGRLCLLPGKNGITLLDDTYNASPASTRAALDTMKEFIVPRKVVILGDMLELGVSAQEEHSALVEPIIAAGAQIVVTVGKHMRHLYEALLVADFPRKQVYWAPDPITAQEVVKSIVRTEDLVLIKGSQGMRLEKIVEVLLADPGSAQDVLCRQSPGWRGRPFSAPAEWTNAM